MKIDVLTIFPEFFREVFDFGIIRRAREAEIVEINVHDIREYTLDKHRKVDDRPFGGGDGMVLTPEPIFRAVENLTGTSVRSFQTICGKRICCGSKSYRFDLRALRRS
jgi:tRNA (guanine37-N1)-methyltransferase